MKILIVLISVLLVSCGGSSSSGGNNGDNPICDKATACAKYGPAKPTASKQPIPDWRAGELIRDNVKKFENIPVGLNFVEHNSCKSEVEGKTHKIITEMTVLKVTKTSSTRNVEYYVKVLSATPNVESLCTYNRYEGEKEYILIRELPTVDQALNSLKDFDDFFITRLNNDSFLLAYDEISSADGWVRNVEVGINLEKSYPEGLYKIIKVKKGNYLVNTPMTFVQGSEVIDTSTIDRTGLPIHYERF